MRTSNSNGKYRIKRMKPEDVVWQEGEFLKVTKTESINWKGLCKTIACLLIRRSLWYDYSNQRALLLSVPLSRYPSEILSCTIKAPGKCWNGKHEGTSGEQRKVPLDAGWQTGISCAVESSPAVCSAVFDGLHTQSAWTVTTYGWVPCVCGYGHTQHTGSFLIYCFLQPIIRALYPERVLQISHPKQISFKSAQWS